MKRSLLLYLTILFALTTLFTYVFLSNEISFEKKRFQKTTVRLKDSLNLITNKWIDADYFSLEKNENAQGYFDNETTEKTIMYEKLIPYVTEKLLDYNANPKGNPYTGQDQIGTTKFIINKIKILNHRWIIADYSNGKIWGEVLLKYFINENETISFEVIQSLIYSDISG